MSQTEIKKQAIVLNHIAVYVADLAKATEFYKDVLG
ncbi:MAG: VOC family protein, partial [Pedobacter sp.]